MRTISMASVRGRDGAEFPCMAFQGRLGLITRSRKVSGEEAVRVDLSSCTVPQQDPETAGNT